MYNHSILNNVKSFLEKYSINDTEVLIAFSGGYDSMCLLHVLNKLKNDFNLTLTAIHLNHNWRGEESLKEAENCKSFCKQLNINFYAEKLATNIKQTETDAREARYNFFENCATKFNSNIVFTAHNADDNAETLIYRIAKGTGLEGLKGILENRDIYYRPLLTSYRKDIENYCKENILTPNSDSSNENTKYKRNHIRKNIIPEIEKINKSAKIAINNLAQNAINDSIIINEYLATLQDKFNTQNFINYSNAVQERIIYQFLIDNNFEYDQKTVIKIINFINENSKLKNGKTLSLTSNNFLFVSKNEIRLIEKDTNECQYRISLTETTLISDKYPSDKEGMAYVDLSTIGNNYEIRHRKDGDIIQPLGTNGTQKLKKYLNEKGVPKDKRDKMIFLCQNNEVLWAPTLGINEKIKVKTNPTHILKLERINEH